MAEDKLQTLKRLAAASGSMTDADATVALKLSVLLQDFQADRLKRFLSEHSEVPVLVSYSVDPTSIALVDSQRQVHGGSSVTRKGKVLTELLMQSLVLKAHGSSPCKPLIVVGYPIPLSEGKTAKHIYSASKSFVPRLREEQHNSFAVVHLCADGALLSSLDARMTASRNLYYSDDGDGAVDDDKDLASIKDLFVSSPCLAHSLQNSLKWAVANLATEETMKGLHVAIESLRNSFSLIHSHLYAFLSSKVSFRGVVPDTDAARALWTAVGIEADVLGDFVDIHPVWDGSRLWVSQELEGSEDLLPRLSFLLLKAFRWQRYTQSRFLTLGSSTRALMCSLLLGLDELVRITRDDPACSDYHLHGYSNLTQASRQLALVCAFASYPAEAGLQILLSDDRLAQQLQEFQTALAEEMDWLQQLPATTWDVLACGAGLEFQGSEARHIVLQAALTSLGYIYSHASSLFEREPWIWTQGDPSQHIGLLKSSGPEAFWHPVSQQIASYLNMGGDEDNVLAVFKLLQECSFSTMGVEQQHGSYATMHRLHPDYSMQSLSTRGFLHSCRALFHESEDLQIQKRLEQLVAKLDRKQPNKVGGRSMFLQEMLTQSETRELQSGSAATGSDHDVFAQQQVVLKSAARAWKSLSHAAQSGYDKTALRYAQTQMRLIQDQKEELRERLSLHVHRQEAPTTSSCRVATCSPIAGTQRQTCRDSSECSTRKNTS